jgi:beta-phosphoglucomutase-like phosphatase (HAD superfamily)
MSDYIYTRTITDDEQTSIKAYTDMLSQNNPVMADAVPTDYIQKRTDDFIQDIIDQGASIDDDATKKDLIEQINALTKDELATIKDTLISTLPVKIKPTPIDPKPIEPALPADNIKP